MTLRDQPDMSGPPFATAADAASKRRKAPQPKDGSPRPPPSAANVARSAAKKRKLDAECVRLEELGAAQFCEDELADALGVDAVALAKRMSGRKKGRLAYEKGRADGLVSLRNAQLKLAETSAPMAIFLGRFYLDQSERREVEPRESNEIAEVAQSVRDRLAALVAEANRNRPGNDRGDA